MRIEIKRTKDQMALASLNEEIQSLHHKLYPKDFKPYNLSMAEKAFKRMLADPGVNAYLATKDGEAIGYILCMTRTRAESEFQYAKTSLLIDQIFVRETSRKQGVAKALLERALVLAREKGIIEIELNHWEANTAAGEFLKKNGFKYFNRQMKRRV